MERDVQFIGVGIGCGGDGCLLRLLACKGTLQQELIEEFGNIVVFPWKNRDGSL
jgi:hypothetical protein